MDREILMNKTTKGAIAAAAAGALLLGGIGSLAYWTDSDPVGGGTFTAGSLSLTPLNGCDTWNLDTAEPGGSPFDPGADRLVPGDVVSKVCTFTIAADGTHLRATVVATPSAASSGDLLTSGPLEFSTDLSVGGSTVTSIDDGDGGETLTVTVRGTFASTSDNTSQTDEAVLPDIDIVTTQAHL